QERHLVIKRFAGVADEDRGDAERAADHERGTAGIPRGVAARLESVADAAAGEAARIGFLLHQHASIEALDAAAATDRFEERIVRLSAEAGERLEPMGIMCGTVGGSPFLHAAGHLIGRFPIDALAVLHSLAYSQPRLLGEEHAHGI